MKTFALYRTALILIFALGFTSCNQEENFDQIKSESQVKKSEGVFVDVIDKDEVIASQLPEGTIVRKTSLGSLTFELPEDVIYAWQDNNGKWIQTNSFGYSCTAADGCGTGCDVLYAQGTYGCTQCSRPASCTGKSTIDQYESINDPADALGSLDSENGGFIFLNDPVRFGTINQLTSLKTPKGFFSHPVVSEALRRFLVENGLTPVEKGAKNVKYLPVVAFGTQLGLAVRNDQQEELARRSPSARNNSLMAGITCSCTQGSGCTKNSGWGYEKCERAETCTTCCMNCPAEHE